MSGNRWFKEPDFIVTRIAEKILQDLIKTVIRIGKKSKSILAVMKEL